MGLGHGWAVCGLLLLHTAAAVNHGEKRTAERTHSNPTLEHHDQTTSAVHLPGNGKGLEQGLPLEALLFQSPLTCTLAVLDWVHSAKTGSTWKDELRLGLLATAAETGVLGGVPQVCVIGICVFLTSVLIVTLFSLAAEEATNAEEEGKAVDLATNAKVLSPTAFGTGAISPSQVQAPPICPKLMLPKGTAQFRIPLESIRNLRSGFFPVQIFGASLDPLLHAWLPRFGPSVGDLGAEGEGAEAPAPHGPGLWLQLTTTSTSRHPHACIGPFRLMGSAAVEADEPIQILGPNGMTYGTFVPTEESWKVVCGDTVVLTVTASMPFPHVSVLDMQGRSIATAIQQHWNVISSDVLVVQAREGADAMLALLCILAFVLLSVDMAVAPVKLAMTASARGAA